MTAATPPERIHGWQRGQLSIARFYGSCTYGGHAYYIAMNEPGQPLVRIDVLRAEAKAAAEKRRAELASEKAAARAAQGDLLGGV